MTTRPGVDGVRLISSYVQTIDGTPDEVFPLLCPVREAEWVDGWVGRPVHAPSGVAEADGVYATRHDGEAEETLWLVTRFDRAAHEIEFATFVPGRQVFRLAVAVRPLGPARSAVSIRYVRTGISAAGNAILAELERTDGDSAMMREWEADMNRYLSSTRLGPSALQ